MLSVAVNDHCVDYCDRIVYLIVYLGDHCVDHLLTQSMAFVESIDLWMGLRRTSQPENGRNRKDAARLRG